MKDFAIENEFGRIDFFGETDLTGADLAKDIVISKESFDIYEGRDMPQRGTKLNKPCMITLYNV